MLVAQFFLTSRIYGCRSQMTAERDGRGPLRGGLAYGRTAAGAKAGSSLRGGLADGRTAAGAKAGSSLRGGLADGRTAATFLVAAVRAVGDPRTPSREGPAKRLAPGP